MALPEITKHRPVQIAGAKFLSAEWEIQGLPGLYMRRNYDNYENQADTSWAFSLMASFNNEKPPSSYVERVFCQIKEQRYPTRIQALQALEMVIRNTQ